VQSTIENCKIAIKLDHKCGDAYFICGHANDILGNKKEAIKNLKMAKKLGCQKTKI
jgi:hypothetical protein